MFKFQGNGLSAMVRGLLTKRFFFLLCAIFLVAFLWVNGWFDSMKSWQEATGYTEIPAESRPIIQAELLVNQESEPSDKVVIAPPMLYWLGHSGFVLLWHDQTILLDPNLSSICTTSRRKFAAPIAPHEFKEIDAVLLSHSHFDHMDRTTLEGISRLKHILVPAGSRSFLQSMVLADSEIHEMSLQESFVLGDITITAVKAKHNGGRLHPLKSNALAVGYIIENGSSTIYFAGDTGFGPHFKEIGRVYHPDVAILPIGAYSPKYPLMKYHLNPEEAVQAAQILLAELTIPCHFGTFQLSLDHPASALPRFAEDATRHGLKWQLAPLFQTR